jgi:hypothetical protein
VENALHTVVSCEISGLQALGLSSLTPLMILSFNLPYQAMAVMSLAEPSPQSLNL